MKRVVNASKWVIIFLALSIVFGGTVAGVLQAQYKVYLPIIIKSPYNPAKGAIIPGNYSFCDDITTLRVGWYYQNTIDPMSGCDIHRHRFVPRIADGKNFTPDDLARAIANAQAGDGWLMGFVEPNYSAWGGYMTPEEGARAWRRVELAALPAGIKLVAPSPSQHAPGTNPKAGIGYTWIGHMITEYKTLKLNDGKKPHFDAFAWNYYGSDPNQHKAFLLARRQDADNMGYKDTPFWVLEYAGACWSTPLGESGTGNTRVMNEVTAWMENAPWIERYAWFASRLSNSETFAPGWQSCSLLDYQNGAQSSLGQIYTGY